MSRPPRPIDCDALVIGSGAGGSVAALGLARAGRETVVLEEGPRVTTAELAAASPAQNLRRLYRHAGLAPIHGRPVIAFGEGCCVGGTTVVNGGLLWEPPADLLDRWAHRAGTDGYRRTDLDGHLREITRRLGVAAQQPGDGNRDSRLLADGADRLGWHWAAARRAAPGCSHANRCPTGCPSGAKQSMLLSYLPAAERHGALIRPRTRVLRLGHRRGRVTEVHAVGPDGEPVGYRPRTVVLAAGPIGTPALLQRSGIHRRRAGRRTAVHVNLKVVARFREPVRATNGTIFTAQLQHFQDEGLLVMPANLTPGALGAALAGHDPRTVNTVLADLDRVALFTAQVRVDGPVTVTALPGGHTLLRHRLTAADGARLRSALHRTARLLLAAGATEIHPPFPGPPLRSEAEARQCADRSALADWPLVSVHAMASCPMGDPAHGGLCDAAGRPYGFDNLHLCDASVLPGATGISPQGTVMAFAHEITERLLQTTRRETTG
ncbi:GMC family oxidoreductase N-terminal domain-containing protein [Kitasatospora sp. NPDC092039]|uniref:GMC family oxidoreductase N-terminal domain-containing protein n=1 Tax=Kitasatospora sp. NPDC092039 TaxID=3364086 RepID=UPI003817A3FB